MVNRVSGWPQAVRWRSAVRATAFVGPLLTCAILSTVRGRCNTTTSVLVLVVWVVAAAATGDRVAGILAAVFVPAWFDFFLTQPYLRFTISDSNDIEATVLLVLISLAVTEVALWGYRQQAQASRRSGYLDGVLGAARVVAEGDMPTEAVIDVVARQIAEALDADSCQFVDGPVREARVAVLDHDGVLTRDGHPVDVERVGLPVERVRRGPGAEGTSGRRPLPRHRGHPRRLSDPRAAPHRRTPGRPGGRCPPRQVDLSPVSGDEVTLALLGQVLWLILAYPRRTPRRKWGYAVGFQAAQSTRESGPEEAGEHFRNEKVRVSNPLSSTTRPRSLTWVFVIPGVPHHQAHQRAAIRRV